jgi:hypothetical protein
MSTPAEFTKEVLAQLEELLEVRRQLQARAVHNDLSDLPEESQTLATRLQAALDRITTPGSTYGRDVEAARAQPTFMKIPELSAIAEALRQDYAKGWIRSVTELINADTFADLLEVATELHAKAYKDSSAVVAGTALEIHLRKLCDKHGIDRVLSSGKAKKADVLNADLRKASIYGPLQQKQIIAWLAIRNSAAHGEYDDYDATDVRRLIEDVGKFMETYPA